MQRFRQFPDHRRSRSARRGRGSGGLPQTLFGKIGLTLFILLWLAIPVTALVLGTGQARENWRIRSWMEVPCTFESAKVDGSGGDFQLVVRYAYEVDGLRHVGTRYSVSQGDSLAFKGLRKRTELLERYAPGTSGVCFVHPSNASQSVLVRESPLDKAVLLFLLILCFMLCIGCGFLYATWHREAPANSNALPAEDPSLPDASQPGRAFRPVLADFIVPAFGMIFLLVGIVLGGFEARSILRDRLVDWQETTGTVLSCEIKAHHGKSTTYSPYVTYHYFVDGREYENDELSKSTISIGDRAAVVRHAARYRPGADVQVFYNPDAPAESFLERGGISHYVLLIVFSLLFAGAGVVMLTSGLRVLLPRGGVPSYETPLTGLRLKRTAGEETERVAFAVVWCVFTFSMAATWFASTGPFSWTWQFWTFDKFLVLLFPVVGIFLAVSSARKVLRRLRTGRYEVEISCDRLRPGARVQVAYRFHGDASRLRHVIFAIEQQNVAYRSTPADGSDPYAKRRDNVWSADGRVVQQGTFVFTLPPRIEGRRIAWRLIVKYARLSDVFRLDVDDAPDSSSPT